LGRKKGPSAHGKGDAVFMAGGGVEEVEGQPAYFWALGLIHIVPTIRSMCNLVVMRFFLSQDILPVFCSYPNRSQILIKMENLVVKEIK
jgi:hypothetical protein